MATDPICGMSVRETSDALTATREARTYYFCSEDCRRTFLQPEKDQRRLAWESSLSGLAGLIVLALVYAPRTRWEGAAELMEPRNWAMLALATPVQFIAGARFYRGLWHAVRARAANMDSLIAIGTTAAYGYSAFVAFVPEAYGTDTYFDVSTIVISFILLGRFLEHRMKRRATAALRKLLALQPRTALVVRDGKEAEVPVEEVRPGDSFRVRAGERIATDGVIVEGTAGMDESMLTGESMPVTKGPGDDVVGGSVNTSGLLLVEARRVGQDTALAQIASLVEAAQAGRAPIQRLVDRVSAVFVPVVVVTAVASFLGWFLVADRPFGEALLPAVAVLIIACPCALGLATPAALLVAAGKGAEQGILVKETDQLEALARVNVILLDKTGTLTQGRPVVTKAVPAPGTDEATLAALVGRAETVSTHPIAGAIQEWARGLGVELTKPSDSEESAGRGIRARIDDAQVLVGTPQWMAEHGVDAAGLEAEAGRLESEGNTVVWAAGDGRPLGLIALRDEPKAGARDAARALVAAGLEVRLVTGDNARTGEAIGRMLGIGHVHARVSPGEKAALVESMKGKGRRVAFVGDGINDAPALAAADVGIALGGGTDVAREAGGIVLLKDDPRDVVNARALGRATLRKVHQNLFWAFIYNVVLVPFAAFALFHPILAGAAMGLSSVTVVGNSLLLLRQRPALATQSAALRTRPPTRSTGVVKRLTMAPTGSGAAIDPVCGMRVDPATAKFRHEWHGRTIHFCSAGCRETFAADPERFASRIR